MNEQIVKSIRIMFSRVWVLLVLAIAGAGAVYITCDREFEKKYEAKMKLFITLSDSRANNINAFDSIRSSQMAAGDISQIIASDTVLAGVESECNVDRLVIERELVVNAIPNTRILDISIEMNTPEKALKLMESLNKNLRIKLNEIDSNISYKMLSMPNVNTTPVNLAYPVLFSIAAAIGGFLLGAGINLATGGRKLPEEGLKHIRGLFEGENILLVPASKIPKQEGGSIL